MRDTPLFRENSFLITARRISVRANSIYADELSQEVELPLTVLK